MLRMRTQHDMNARLEKGTLRPALTQIFSLFELRG